jgi:hypothetical protein
MSLRFKSASEVNESAGSYVTLGQGRPELHVDESRLAAPLIGCDVSQQRDEVGLRWTRCSLAWHPVSLAIEGHA